MVEVDDCARGHVLAAEHGIAGVPYILNGSSSSISELVDKFNVITGRNLAPRFCQLVSGFWWSGIVIELGGRIARRRPPSPAVRWSGCCGPATYDGSRATKSWGWCTSRWKKRSPLPWTGFCEQGLVV